MSDDMKQNDITIIEDTGESLEDFVYEEPEKGEAGEEGSDNLGEEESVEKVDVEEPPSREEEIIREVEEWKDRCMRAMAELENYKKRSARDRREQVRLEMAAFFQEFLPIVDNFHRAVETEYADFASYRQGVEMTLKQIDQMLARKKIQEIEVKPGDKFDPLYHEALSSTPSEDVESPTIGEVMQKGYLMDDKLLRPVLTMVLLPAPKQKGDEDVENPGD